jgi:hypothetical protein
MRTTVDLDPDVLSFAKSIAAYRKQTLGKVISDLCRRSVDISGQSTTRNGVQIIQRPPNSNP